MAALKNQKHERFVVAIVATSESSEDIGRAYLSCYPKVKDLHVATTAAMRLLKKVDVRARLQEYRGMASGRAAERLTEVVVDALLNKKLDKQWLLTKAKSILERCMQEEQVFDSEGKPTGEYTFQHVGANRALELIAKVQGHLAPVQTQEVPLSIEAWMDSLSDDQRKIAMENIKKRQVEAFGGDETKFEEYRQRVLAETPVGVTQ